MGVAGNGRNELRQAGADGAVDSVTKPPEKYPVISPLKKIPLSLALCVPLLAVACSGGFVKSLGDMAGLGEELIDKYDGRDGGVSLQNCRYLSIVFVNSPLNEQGATIRAKRAQETARFVVANFPAIGKIQNIWIMFVASESRWIFYHHSKSIDAFVFDKDGEELRNPGRSEAEDARAPVVKFNAARNETDVRITRIQLEGDLNHGIALVPHFTVRGNARNPNGKTAAPALVGFDFASYADRKIFSVHTKLEIRWDDQLTFADDAHLLSPEDSGSNGSTAQFLTDQIPFAKFAQMGKARERQIDLGRKQFTLTPEVIDALRRMAAYVPEPPRRRRFQLNT